MLDKKSDVNFMDKKINKYQLINRCIKKIGKITNFDLVFNLAILHVLLWIDDLFPCMLKLIFEAS